MLWGQGRALPWAQASTEVSTLEEEIPPFMQTTHFYKASLYLLSPYQNLEQSLADRAFSFPEDFGSEFFVGFLFVCLFAFFFKTYILR